jgi:DNA-binding NarL/FixJ family response regulator
MVAPRPIRVIIADDHPVVRKGLRATLEPESTVEIVGEASSYVQLTDLLQTVPADAVLLDISGMGTPPITAISGLRRTYPKLAIIVFSGSVGGARELLKLGASGYVAKEDMEDDIVMALHTVVDGDTFLSPMVRDYLERADLMRNEHGLTPKEWQVLHTIAAGLGTQQAAEELGIAEQTIRNYMQVLYRKTGCTARTQLVDWFRQYGTVDE